MNADDLWMLAGEHCTERELRVLHLRRSDYQTWEIADALGISPSAVRWRQKRALDRIRNRTTPRHGWSDT